MKHAALGFLDSANPTMEGIIDLHHYIFFYLILILVFVTWVFFSCFYYALIILKDQKLDADSEKDEHAFLNLSNLINFHKIIVYFFYDLKENKKNYFIFFILGGEFFLIFFLYYKISLVWLVLYAISFFTVIFGRSILLHCATNESVSPYFFFILITCISRIIIFVLERVLATETCFSMIFIKPVGGGVFNPADVGKFDFQFPVVIEKIWDDGEKTTINLQSKTELEFPYGLKKNLYPSQTMSDKITDRFWFYKQTKQHTQDIGKYERFNHSLQPLMYENLLKENESSLVSDFETLLNFNQSQQGAMVTNLSSSTKALNKILENKVYPLSFIEDNFIWHRLKILPEELLGINKKPIINNAVFQFEKERIFAVSGLIETFPSCTEEILKTLKRHPNTRYDFIGKIQGISYNIDVFSPEKLNEKTIFDMHKYKLKRSNKDCENTLILINNGANKDYARFQEILNKECINKFKGKIIVASDQNIQYFSEFIGINKDYRLRDFNNQGNGVFQIEGHSFDMITNKETFEKALNKNADECKKFNNIKNIDR